MMPIEMRKSSSKKIKSEESEENSPTMPSLKLPKALTPTIPLKFQSRPRKRSETFSAKFTKLIKCLKSQSMTFLNPCNQRPSLRDLLTEREMLATPEISSELKVPRDNLSMTSRPRKPLRT